MSIVGDAARAKGQRESKCHHSFMEIAHLHPLAGGRHAADYWHSLCGNWKLITQKIPATVSFSFAQRHPSLHARLRWVVSSCIMRTAGFCPFGSRWDKEIHSELCKNGAASTLASPALTTVKIKESRGKISLIELILGFINIQKPLPLSTSDG